ncbi:MAG: hypothetical protein WA030_00220 [Candidatus Microsaccharimonas sp.]
MAINMTRKKILIVVGVIVILIGGVAVYAFMTGFFTPSKTANTSTDTPSTTHYEQEASFKKKQSQVTKLVEAGDEASIKEAEAIAKAETEAAEKSGNDAYIVDAALAQALLFIDTGRAQQALDEILLPLEQKYGTNDTYRFLIYAVISRAYTVLGDTTKATEYYQKIPEKGWD